MISNSSLNSNRIVWFELEKEKGEENGRKLTQPSSPNPRPTFLFPPPAGPKSQTRPPSLFFGRPRTPPRKAQPSSHPLSARPRRQPPTPLTARRSAPVHTDRPSSRTRAQQPRASPTPPPYRRCAPDPTLSELPSSFSSPATTAPRSQLSSLAIPCHQPSPKSSAPLL